MILDYLRQLVSRREAFNMAALLAAAGFTRGRAAELKLGPSIYESIGVRPVINGRGTLTIIGGSQSLPEVKRAMEEASKHYVHIDELMDAVGQRLSQITKAEWGIVTSGCAAGLAHVTAACIAGCNPEKMQRLPHTAGMKNQVVVPAYSRNVYDHAVRMTGAEFVEVRRKEDFAAAFNEKTAMVMVLAGPEDSGPFGLPFIAEIAKAKGVPVLVDAAAEDLTIPNIHLQRGATVVGYSGGKVLRGPQCAGLMLGDKKLLQAAWINSAPHHAFGRPMKVGREEIMGMLAAVEMWPKRDIASEYKEKERYLHHIAARVQKISGVTAEVLHTKDLSNHAPRLRVKWDPEQLGATGQDVALALYEGSPRIDIGPSNRNLEAPRDGINVGAHMMMPGDEKIVAERLATILVNPPKRPAAARGGAPSENLTGQWDVAIQFHYGDAAHSVVFEQKGNRLMGTHRGDFLQGDLDGTIEGNDVRFRSSHKYEGTRIGYRFTGTLRGDSMAGTLNLGEYGTAEWTAQRHPYRNA